MINLRLFFLLPFVILAQITSAQVLLDADGPGGVDTYDLMNSVLAPGYDAVEEPDCSHTPTFQHIDELFDTTLGINVFRFYLHVATDTDRCNGSTDRQRNEIKTYDKSPDNLLGVEGETVIYKWKFKLDAGFQVSPNFTHIHQLKSVGGLYSSMPMYTLTCRKSTPDRIELRYAETNSQTTLIQTDIAPFKGEWVEATETIKYGTNSSPDAGTYSIELKRVSDQAILLSYTDNAVKNWQTDADFVRPKWGIYRSLNNAQDLRDEEVLFANFSIEESPSLSNSDLQKRSIRLHPNPTEKYLFIEKLNNINFNYITIYDFTGKKLISKKDIDKINVSQLPKGIYFMSLKTQNDLVLKKIFIKK
ncbi:T9SS type A sorting domain-containing protein [Seonamhaeicola maritimus]|uniref:T9SS type A sorting domain-containing protein n=1 Tax=Seonamhaeicola maritimus TaxID=2591822 RepID=A0A5C7GKB7_9FLAO|nr:T9SS type A sorting domain-containing protein [Seonamhaeicola maritimus]TXG38916.1 T9SS type A sorting domain-containing protein [Seonamhaeicola maritimus]